MIFCILILIFFYRVGFYDTEIGTLLGTLTGISVIASTIFLDGGLEMLLLLTLVGYLGLAGYKLLLEQKTNCPFLNSKD